MLLTVFPTWSPWRVTPGHGDDEPDTEEGEARDDGDQEALHPVHADPDLDPVSTQMWVTWCQHTLSLRSRSD